MTYSISVHPNMEKGTCVVNTRHIDQNSAQCMRQDSKGNENIETLLIY